MLDLVALLLLLFGSVKLPLEYLLVVDLLKILLQITDSLDVVSEECMHYRAPLHPSLFRYFSYDLNQIPSFDIISDLGINVIIKFVLLQSQAIRRNPVYFQSRIKVLGLSDAILDIAKERLSHNLSQLLAVLGFHAWVEPQVYRGQTRVSHRGLCKILHALNSDLVLLKIDKSYVLITLQGQRKFLSEVVCKVVPCQNEALSSKLRNVEVLGVPEAQLPPEHIFELVLRTNDFGEARHMLILEVVALQINSLQRFALHHSVGQNMQVV